MGPIWGRQDPGGPHVGPMNFAIWADANFVVPISDVFLQVYSKCLTLMSSELNGPIS